MSPQESAQAFQASLTSMASLKGSKGTQNQDRALYLLLDGVRRVEMLGMFDGHGEDGHYAAEIASEGLPKLIFRELRAHAETEAVVNAFDEAAVAAFADMHLVLEDLTAAAYGQRHCMQQAAAPWPLNSLPLFDARASGTTATLALIMDGLVCLAHVGDSKAVLGVLRGGAWHVLELTRDHTPDLPGERKRIEASGAQVIATGPPTARSVRVRSPRQPWPMINMSRSLGDLHAHTQGLSIEAECRVCRELVDKPYEEAVLVVASDGVWDVIDAESAVEIVCSRREDPDAATALSREAFARWAQRGLQEGYSDDITAIAKFF